MRYIVTEDAKSGFQFWKALAHCIDKDIVVICGRGNKGMLNAVKGLPLKPNDYLLVALDRIGDAVEDILTGIIKYCNFKKVIVEFTEYYCLEEVFISYTGWGKRGINLPKEGSECDLAFNALRHCINADLLYNPLEIDACQKFINMFSLQRATKEHILTILLQQYTRKSTYRIGKKSISSCWITDCCPMLADNPVVKLCNVNTNINKQETLRSKMKDLCNHSSIKKDVKKLCV